MQRKKAFSTHILFSWPKRWLKHDTESDRQRNGMGKKCDDEKCLNSILVCVFLLVNCLVLVKNACNQAQWMSSNPWLWICASLLHSATDLLQSVYICSAFMVFFHSFFFLSLAVDIRPGNLLSTPSITDRVKKIDFGVPTNTWRWRRCNVVDYGVFFYFSFSNIIMDMLYLQREPIEWIYSFSC